MDNKEKYLSFIETVYVPIYSQPWWLDAICLPEKAWGNMSSNYRKNCKKGSRNGIIRDDMDEVIFYSYHEQVFIKQGLKCPFSRELWERLYKACCVEHKCGRVLYSMDENRNVQSVLFLVWDEESVYHLLGGNMPGYQQLETYSALTWEGIRMSRRMNLHYDFEGSMIKRISKSFREYGGEPRCYFRIRKVFKKEILVKEHMEQLEKFQM